jgi:hypothetical protein
MSPMSLLSALQEAASSTVAWKRRFFFGWNRAESRDRVKKARNSCEICQINGDGFWASLREIIEQSSYCARCRAVLTIIEKFQQSIGLAPAGWSVRMLCAPQEPVQIRVYNPTAPGTNSIRSLSCFRKQGKVPNVSAFAISS